MAPVVVVGFLCGVIVGAGAAYVLAVVITWRWG